MAVVAGTILSAPGRNRRSVVAGQGLRVLIFARLLHGGAGPGSSSQTAEHAWMRALYDMFTTGMLKRLLCRYWDPYLLHPGYESEILAQGVPIERPCSDSHLNLPLQRTLQIPEALAFSWQQSTNLRAETEARCEESHCRYHPGTGTCHCGMLWISWRP